MDKPQDDPDRNNFITYLTVFRYIFFYHHSKLYFFLSQTICLTFFAPICFSECVTFLVASYSDLHNPIQRHLPLLEQHSVLLPF